MLSLNKNNDKYSQTQTNELVSADDIKYENKEENIVENIVMEESVEVSNNNDIEQVDSTESKIEKQDVSNKNNEKSNNNTTNKVITKETTTQTETTTTEKNTNSISKSEEKKEPNIVEKPKEDVAKDNEESSTNKEATNNIKTEEIKDNSDTTAGEAVTNDTKTEEIIETPKCNHSNENYYNTEEEAIAFYKKTSKEYGNKVKNGEITYEEYLKLCPYGYETMSCPLCEKWTISFYYE